MTLMAGASDWRVLVSPNTNGATQMRALGIENKVGVALGANQVLSKVRLLGISRFARSESGSEQSKVARNL